MRYLLSLWALALLLASGLQSAQAQALKEGQITYEVKVEGAKSPMANLANGALLEYIFSGDLSSFKGSMMGGLMVMDFTNNAKTQDALMLMQMMGQRKAVSLKAKDIQAMQKEQKQANALPPLKYSNSNKTIAGYACRKAQTTLPDGQKLTLFLCEEMPSLSNPMMGKAFSQVKGVPLAAEIKDGSQVIRILATKIEKKAPANSFPLKAPAGYEVLTWEQWQDWLLKQQGGMPGAKP